MGTHKGGEIEVKLHKALAPKLFQSLGMEQRFVSTNNSPLPVSTFRLTASEIREHAL
jgi:hypothetical protein